MIKPIRAGMTKANIKCKGRTRGLVINNINLDIWNSENEDQGQGDLPAVTPPHLPLKERKESIVAVLIARNIIENAEEAAALKAIHPHQVLSIVVRLSPKPFQVQLRNQQESIKQQT
jgi:hypothetical protein